MTERISRNPVFTRVFSAAAALMLAAGIASAEKFTIMILPDTQHEVFPNTHQIFENRLDWIAATKTTYNTKFVLQVGDQQNWPTSDGFSQYAYTSAAFEKLEAAGIPYIGAIGNHDSWATGSANADGSPCYCGGSASPGDTRDNHRNTWVYNMFYPLSRYTNLGGSCEPNKMDNTWHTFTAGGMNWLMMNIEMWPRTEVVNWAKSVAATHPHHNIFITIHWFSAGDNSMQYGDNSPKFLNDEFVSKYPNIKGICWGHSGTHSYSTMTGACGNVIHQFLQCYHDASNPTRILEIDTAGGQMRSNVYMPYTNAYKTDGSSFTVSGLTWIAATGDFRPLIALMSPRIGASVSGTVPVEVSAFDDVSVNRVVYYVDNVAISTATAAPYGLDWDTTRHANGTRVLRAEVFDDTGKSFSDDASVIIDNSSVIYLSDGFENGLGSWNSAAADPGCDASASQAVKRNGAYAFKSSDQSLSANNAFLVKNLNLSSPVSVRFSLYLDTGFLSSMGTTDYARNIMRLNTNDPAKYVYLDVVNEGYRGMKLCLRDSITWGGQDMTYTLKENTWYTIEIKAGAPGAATGITWWRDGFKERNQYGTVSFSPAATWDTLYLGLGYCNNPAWRQTAYFDNIRISDGYNGSIAGAAEGGPPTPPIGTNPGGTVSVKIGPNPFVLGTPGSRMSFNVTGINTGELKIFTLSGKLVNTISVNSGAASWDGTNKNGSLVGKGLYMYTINDGQGNRSGGKLAVN